jgi:hypothetical protein
MTSTNIPEEERKNKGAVYAAINKEAATLLGGGDSIVFAPAEDFEYTAPLEDFQKSLQQEERGTTL